MAEWQPIETAPKDGTEILGFERMKTGDYFKVVYWTLDGDDIYGNGGNPVPGWTAPDDGYVGGFSPTHWQPLPDPPEADAAEVAVGPV